MGQLTVLPGGTTRVPQSDDADLIERARDGDENAFGELYRRYFPAALRAARSYVRPAHLAEDVVSDVFDSVWGALRNGRGPTESFQPYLITAIRNRAIRLASRPTDGVPIDEHHPLLIAPDAEPPTDDGFAKRAFEQLPTREREVLWLTAVEGQSPAEAALALALSERAAASLRFRAKRTFAELYLAERGAAAATSTACRDLSPKLSRYVRGTCPPLARRNVERHLSACPSCQDVVGDLQSVNATLRSALLPGIALVSPTGGSTSPGLAVRLGAGTLRALTSKAVLAVAAVGVVAILPANALFGGTPPLGPEHTQIPEPPQVDESERAPTLVRPARPDEARVDLSRPEGVAASFGPKRLAGALMSDRPAPIASDDVADGDPVVPPPTSGAGPTPTEPVLTGPPTLPPIVTAPSPIVTDPSPLPTTPNVTSPPIPAATTVASVGVTVESPIADANVGLTVGDNGVAIKVDASVPIVAAPAIAITLPPLTVPSLLGG